MRWCYIIAIVHDGNRPISSGELVYTNTAEELLRKRVEDDLAAEYPSSLLRHAEVIDLTALLFESGLIIREI